jgi:hypothetical protein
MSETATLSSEIKRVEVLARDAGLRRAADWIEEQRAKRWPGRGHWNYGRCVWCDAEGRRRMATQLDTGSGTPECDQHAEERDGAPDA